MPRLEKYMAVELGLRISGIVSDKNLTMTIMH